MFERARRLALFVVGVTAILAGILGLRSVVFAQPSGSQQPFIDKLVLSDTIQPVTAGQLDRAIAQANSDGAQALLIELDTPGGLLESTRGMVGAILSSRVPVIVYVSPAGARAGSAGFFLLEAADVAAMAPGTNAGAAHPVLEFGAKPDETEGLIEYLQSVKTVEAALGLPCLNHACDANTAVMSDLFR